jgi:hypothetical protein
VWPVVVTIALGVSTDVTTDANTFTRNVPAVTTTTAMGSPTLITDRQRMTTSTAGTAGEAIARAAAED